MLEVHPRLTVSLGLTGGRALTAVSGAQIEGVHRPHSQGEEELPVHELGADDRPVGRRDELLKEQNVIWSKQLVFLSEQILKVLTAWNVPYVRAASSGIGLEDGGKWKAR